MKTKILTALLLLGFPHFLTAAEGILPKDGDKIAFLGDSITAGGWGTEGGYVRLVVNGLAKKGVSVTPIPAGVGGHKSNDMLARLENDVLSKDPDWMTLSCGVNDVWHGDKGVDLEDYKKNITAIVDQAEAQGVKVVILTSTPIGEESNAHNDKLAAYNDFLRALATERNLPLADLAASFRDYLAPRNPEKTSRYLTVDGVHMNPEGNVLIAKGVLRAFGLTPAEIAEIEKEWLGQKDTATIGNYPFDPRPRFTITLGQYRALSEVAERNNTSLVDMVVGLWLRSLAEVVGAQDPKSVLKPEEIKTETQKVLAGKLAELESGK